MAKGTTTVPNELSEGMQYYSSEKLSAGTSSVMAKYGTLINRYCGSVPSRLVAARIYLETGGNPAGVAKAQTWKCSGGDVYGSEMGLLQINPCNRQLYGLSDAQAKNPETNIKYGCKIWNNWTNTFFAEQGGVSARAVWAWLVTAVGPNATRKLRELAGGYSLGSLMAVAGNATAMSVNSGHWGSQSPALVAWRVGVAISAAKASGALGGNLLVSIGAAALGYYLMRRYA